MASVTLQLETAIVAALRTALTPAGAAASTARVIGFRELAAPHTVKSSDGDGRPDLRVAVNPPSASNFGACPVEFDVALTLFHEYADDPTLAAFDAVAETVENWLQQLNISRNWDAMSSALSTANFSAEGFSLRGGQQAADLGSTPQAITAVYNFAVAGLFIPTPAETGGGVSPRADPAETSESSTETTTPTQEDVNG